MTTITYKRRTSPLFALTPQEHDTLSTYGWKNLDLFKQDRGNQSAWFDITSRIRFGFELARDYCDDMTTLELKLCYDTCVKIPQRAMSSDVHVWSMTQTEIDTISVCLDMVDQIQRKLPKMAMAKVMRSVVTEMRKQYIPKEELLPLPPKRVR